MFSWMLEAPSYTPDRASETAFQAALTSRDPAQLPTSVPRWVFLEWLARRGYLLHGSNRDDLATFEPRTPNDRGPDGFSKRTAVFALQTGSGQ